MWKDATSYNSKYPKGSSNNPDEPQAWEIGGRHLKIHITKGHISYRGEWVMHCHQIGIDTHHLGDFDLETAKSEALMKVSSVLQRMNASFEAMNK